MKTKDNLINEIESIIFNTSFSLITEYKTHNQFVNWGVLKNKSVRYILTKGGKSAYVGNYVLVECNAGIKQFDTYLGLKEVATELENIIKLLDTLTNPLKKEVMQLENNFRGLNV